MASFREQFGLEYLDVEPKQGEDKPATAPATAAMDDALIAYGRLVLDALNKSPNKTRQILDLAPEVRVRIDTLLRLEDYLVTKGYVEKAKEDPLGNDAIRLTPQGEKLLS